MKKPRRWILPLLVVAVAALLAGRFLYGIRYLPGSDLVEELQTTGGVTLRVEKNWTRYPTAPVAQGTLSDEALDAFYDTLSAARLQQYENGASVTSPYRYGLTAYDGEGQAVYTVTLRGDESLTVDIRSFTDSPGQSASYYLKDSELAGYLDALPSPVPLYQSEDGGWTVALAGLDETQDQTYTLTADLTGPDGTRCPISFSLLDREEIQGFDLKGGVFSLTSLYAEDIQAYHRFDLSASAEEIYYGSCFTETDLGLFYIDLPIDWDEGEGTPPARIMTGDGTILYTTLEGGTLRDLRLEGNELSCFEILPNGITCAIDIPLA